MSKESLAIPDVLNELHSRVEKLQAEKKQVVQGLVDIYKYLEIQNPQTVTLDVGKGQWLAIAAYQIGIEAPELRLERNDRQDWRSLTMRVFTQQQFNIIFDDKVTDVVGIYDIEQRHPDEEKTLSYYEMKGNDHLIGAFWTQEKIMSFINEFKRQCLGEKSSKYMAG